MKFFGIKYFLLLWLLWASILRFHAQLDNRPLFWDDSIASDSSKWYLRLKALHYIKNNEYDSPFAAGETFFGWQINPELGLRLHPHIRCEGGFYLPYAFGSGPTWNFFPTLRLRLPYHHWEFIAGSLINTLSHRLSESLYEFENLFRLRPENGIQVRFKNSRIFTDVWIDWRKKTFLNSSESEHFRAGYSGMGSIMTGSIRWDFFLQTMALHYGGQLDTSSALEHSDFAFCSGAAASVPFGNVYLVPDVRYCISFNQSDEAVLTEPPKTGSALWCNLKIRFYLIEISPALFYGNQYRFESGNPWFSSLSFENSRNRIYFQRRALGFIRVGINFEIWNTIKGLFRAEYIYDFNLSHSNYNLGLYFTIDRTEKLIK